MCSYATEAGLPESPVLKPTFDRALCAHGCGLLASPGS